MSLEKPVRSRERILLMGPWNSGKTYTYCNIAGWARRTGSSSRFYIIDTDRSVDRVLEEFGEDAYQNIELNESIDWQPIRDALTDYLKVGTREDFLVVDMIDKVWDRVQDHFIETVWGETADAFMLEYRRSSAANPLNEEGGWGINWQTINKLYYGFCNDMVQRWPGHIICCTPVDPIRQPDNKGKGGDSKEILKQYGRWNYKPSGQKKLGHFFHTIIVTSESNDGWQMTNIKDRGRQKFIGKPINDFTMDYLVEEAGWTL